MHDEIVSLKAKWTARAGIAEDEAPTDGDSCPSNEEGLLRRSWSSLARCVQGLLRARRSELNDAETEPPDHTELFRRRSELFVQEMTCHEPFFEGLRMLLFQLQLLRLDRMSDEEIQMHTDAFDARFATDVSERMRERQAAQWRHAGSQVA